MIRIKNLGNMFSNCWCIFFLNLFLLRNFCTSYTTTLTVPYIYKMYLTIQALSLPHQKIIIWILAQFKVCTPSPSLPSHKNQEQPAMQNWRVDLRHLRFIGNLQPTNCNVKLLQCYDIFLPSLNLTCKQLKTYLNPVINQHIRERSRKPSTQ